MSTLHGKAQRDPGSSFAKARRAIPRGWPEHARGACPSQPRANIPLRSWRGVDLAGALQDASSNTTFSVYTAASGLALLPCTFARFFAGTFARRLFPAPAAW